MRSQKSIGVSWMRRRSSLCEYARRSTVNDQKQAVVERRDVVLHGMRVAALVGAVAALVVPGRALAATTVSGLEANANPAPLGIDDPTPTLSWRLASTERAAVQSKYHVVVATTAAKAAAGAGDVWDSGEVASDRNTAVYAGPPLASRTRYYWSVKTDSSAW